MRILRKEINFLIQVVEAILQYRMQRTKKLLQHFSTIRNEIRKSYKFETYDEAIFSSLAPQQSFHIRSKCVDLGFGKLSSNDQSISIRLKFQVFLKSTCGLMNEQNWLFTLKKSPQFQFMDKKKSNWAMLDLIDQIIRHLIYFELIPQKKGKSQQKNKYLIDYAIQYGPSKSTQDSFPIAKNTWYKKIFSKIQNETEGFALECFCFYQNHQIFKYLQSGSEEKMPNLVHKKSEEEMTTCTRRVSVFEMYDEDLEMILLSGNEIKCQKKLSEVCLQMEEEEQFQMLVEETRTLDKIFMEENRSLMKELAGRQNTYFQYQ